MPFVSYNKQLWAVIYPIDVIKSRMQTDGFSVETGKKYKSTWDCVRTVWRTEGIGAFTRGLGPTLIRYGRNPFLNAVDTHAHDCPFFRSPFANGATFLGFEMAMRALDKL